MQAYRRGDGALDLPRRAAGVAEAWMSGDLGACCRSSDVEAWRRGGMELRRQLIQRCKVFSRSKRANVKRRDHVAANRQGK